MSHRSAGFTLLPYGARVDTHWLVNVRALALFNDVGVVVTGHVPVATHSIVDMLA